MLEITKEQLLKLNNETRIKVLKYIALGLIKFKECDNKKYLNRYKKENEK